MTIWIDMTNSMQTWRGKVVGIVRAELEFVKNLHKLDPEIRFCASNGKSFYEIKSEDLLWLWSATSVGDAYCEHFARQKKTQQITEERLVESYPALKQAIEVSSSRLIRLKRALSLSLDFLLPRSISFVLKKPARVIFNLLLEFRSKRYQNHKSKQISVSSVYECIFHDGDVFFSCGWIGSGKESIIESYRRQVDFKVIYLVYDLIIAKQEFKHLFHEVYPLFVEYLRWISSNCDFVVYGGRTAQDDTEEYFKSNNLRIPDGSWIKFGDSVIKTEQNLAETGSLAIFNGQRFILSVGSFEPRKNYKTLYDAYYLMVNELPIEEVPNLVIVGNVYADKDLYSMFVRQPLIAQKVKIIQPSDEELQSLYQQCEFTVLPTMYEGWSLVLPESLNYGKFCICSDVKPLREVGQDYVSYVNATDPRRWMEEILLYFNDKALLKKAEEKITLSWRAFSWGESADMLYSMLSKEHVKKNNASSKDAKWLFFDISLIVSAALTGGHVSGILRTQLIMARLLFQKTKGIRFFSLLDEYCEYDYDVLSNILSDVEIDKALLMDKEKIVSKYSRECTSGASCLNKSILAKNAFWLFISVLSVSWQKRLIGLAKKIQQTNRAEKLLKLTCPFKEGDIVFESAFCPRARELVSCHEEAKFKYIQLIYDYTPILVPQTHKEETVSNYCEYLQLVNNLADFIFYGGDTARRDGERYQRANSWEIKPSYVVKFGSNIVSSNRSVLDKNKVFAKYGITGEFILTVGSIEARKNHETLYRAYLKLLADGKNNVPQLVICGYPGWKSSDFVSRLDNDERVKGKILRISATDDELKLLYEECKFTVLPSLYEGWSLTLPESLNYGKFCIVSDVPPLREIGADFVDYVPSVDCEEWANKIFYYSINDDVLRAKEFHIKRNWKSIQWSECVDNLYQEIESIHRHSTLP